MVSSDRHIRDTRDAVSVALVRENAAGHIAPVNITDLDITFKVVDKFGIEIVSPSSSGVVVRDAVRGYVDIGLPDEAVSSGVGVAFLYVMITEGGSTSTFPAKRQGLRLIIHED